MVAVNVEVSFGGVTHHVFRTVGQQIVNAKTASSVLGASAVRTLIAKVAPSAKQNQQIPPSHTQ